MGEFWEDEGLGNIGGFQATNIGRALAVSFYHLPSVLGGLYNGKIRNKKK